MYYIEKYGRYFAVMKDSKLICVCVYRKGARAVIDLLTANQPPAMAVFFTPYLRKNSLLQENFPCGAGSGLISHPGPAGVAVCGLICTI